MTNKELKEIFDKGITHARKMPIENIKDDINDNCDDCLFKTINYKLEDFDAKSND